MRGPAPGPRFAAALLAAALTLPLGGCAVTLDLVSLAVPGQNQVSEPPTTFEVGEVERERRIRFEPGAGVICEDVETSPTETLTTEARYDYGDGVEGMLWVGTVIDFMAVSLAVLGRELCADPGCADRTILYPIMAPVAASMVWGLVRALTVRGPAILDASTQAAPTTLEVTTVSPCPPGVAVELEVAGRTEELPLDEYGALEEGFFDLLFDLLSLGGEVHARVRGEAVRVDEGSAERVRRSRGARVGGGAEVRVRPR